MDKAGFGIKVWGKGGNNNQPLLALTDQTYTYAFYRDTLPNQVINALNTTQKSLQNKLAQYIKLYKPSVGCINGWRMNLRYYVADLYYSFKENNKFQVEDAYHRNFAQWQRVVDSLFSLASLNNDSALAAFYYEDLAGNFLGGKRNIFRMRHISTPSPFTGSGTMPTRLKGRSF